MIARIPRGLEQVPGWTGITLADEDVTLTRRAAGRGLFFVAQGGCGIS